MQNNSPVEKLIVPGSQKLYVIFGGIAAGLNMPPFEFYKSAQILNENKLFLRDLHQCWYHKGLDGISTDIDSTAIYLENEIGALQPNELFFIGNSMGGYAAMLFSTLIGYGNAIAFAPQTFISPCQRIKYRDFRWAKQIFKTYSSNGFKSRFWDLKVLLEKQKKDQVFSIYVSSVYRLDRIHAEHLEKIPGVKVYKIDSDSHSIVKILRDNGELPKILSKV